MIELEDLRTDEASKWSGVRSTAEAALDFHIAFLGCRKGANNDETIDTAARGRLLKILRAVSWVESKHATIGQNQPKRDPIQCGNPADAWWKELTGQSGQGSRFIRKPGLGNLWANELANAAEQSTGFDGDAALGKLADKVKGHTNSTFAHARSFYWGVVYLIHRINTSAGDASYQCADLSRDRLVDGAVSYNGGGDSGYREKINDALSIIGELPLREVETQVADMQRRHEIAVTMVRQISALKEFSPHLLSVRLDLDRDGSLKSMDVTFTAG